MRLLGAILGSFLGGPLLRTQRRWDILALITRLLILGWAIHELALCQAAIRIEVVLGARRVAISLVIRVVRLALLSRLLIDAILNTRFALKPPSRDLPQKKEENKKETTSGQPSHR